MLCLIKLSYRIKDTLNYYRDTIPVMKIAKSKQNKVKSNPTRK